MGSENNGAFIRNIAEVPWREFPNHFGGALSKPLVMPETAGSRHIDYRISMYQPMAHVARHKHLVQEQIYHVLEGEGLMEIAGKNHVVRKHDFIFLPPGPNIGVIRLQAGQQKPDMFSINPRIGMFTFRNIAMPRRASISARSCGVETITAPASGACCAMVSCASPVPGGKSTTRRSRSAHDTWCSICVIAEITIGPRQIMARSSSTRKPIDITLTPKRSIGSSMPPPACRGLPRRPNSFGSEGP